MIKISIDNQYTIKLPSLEFYKGDTITIPFEFYYPNNELIDLERTDVRFYLFPYGQYSMPVEFGANTYKAAVLSEVNVNKCTVILYPFETQNLEYNKYSYQPILFFNDGTNRQYIRSEGDIIFKDSYMQ